MVLPQLTYGSVCSGIEAATQAWHPLGWKPAFFSEIDKFPRAVLSHHYPDVPLHGDFTTIEAGQYDPIDLLVGGTPCQSFSIAGLRGGLGDDRGNLALEYLRLAQRLRPRWLVWENVPGVFSSLSHNAPDQCPPAIDLDGDNGPADGEEVVVTDEYESDENHALSCLLAGFSELGYGWAYRVLDAQYTRTRSLPFAVPQRRRRVFVVGYLGDRRRAAAVLFDRQSLSGDPAPRREAGQRVAPTISARTTGGGGLGTDFDLDGGLIAADVAPTLNAHFGDKLGLENQHINQGGGCSFAPPVSNPLTARMHKGINTTLDEGQTLIANGGVFDEVASVTGQGNTHALRGEGFDASEDGTGRGTPIIAFNSREDPEVTGDRAGPLSASSPQAQAVAIQERAVCENPNSGPDGVGVRDDGSAYTVEARTTSQAVAFDMRGREGGAMPEGPHDTANIRAASGGSSRSYVATEWAVRRLTPRECERLQGFPDDYTRIPWRGKSAEECPDGHRYKGLGNSMAKNVMEWLGERIQLVETLTTNLNK